MDNLRKLKKIFKNKKILITGHTGFKGSWLTQIFLLLESKVMGISLPLTPDNILFKILNIKKNILHYEFDLSKDMKYRDAIVRFKPNYVFHLAAQSLVINSIKDPYYTFRNNINSTLNLFECLKKIKSIKSIIFTSSDKCYDFNNKKIFFKESDPLGGRGDAYSYSKSSGELIFKNYLDYYLKHNVGAASVRAGNVIGGGDWSNFRLIPDFIKSIKNNKKFILRNPKSIRPWQHVFDCLFGYILLAYKLKKKRFLFSGSWNFGPTHSGFPAKKIVSIFTKYLSFKNKIKVIQLKKNKYLETKNLHLNTKKVRSKLKYENSLNIFQSLKLTADWYDMYLKKRSSLEMINFSNNQILNFLQKLKY
jgi:CDP-glucose 4,6-dehydratase